MAPGSRVTRLELFYDLIFVFAFLNVTGLAARHPTPRSLYAGAVVLALLWWCWTGFVALSNTVRADHGVIPLVGMAIMTGVFVLAITIPQAFVDQPDDLPGPLVFAVAYLFVRAVTVAGFLLVLTSAGHTRGQFAVLTVPALVAAVLVVLSVVLPRWIPAEAVTGTRLALWSAALLAEYSVGLVLPYARWSVASAAHWAERHGLIVLIALGEAVISLGIGPGRFDRLALTIPVIAACALGIVLIAALWWLHFDTLSPSVEQTLHRVRDLSRVPLARDVFTYLHLVLIFGVVSTALGLKLVLETLAMPGADRLPWSAVGTLYAGVLLYVLAGVAIGLRLSRRPRPSDLTAAAVVVALIGPATFVDPLVALAALTTVCCALAVVQRFTGKVARQRVKAMVRAEEQVAEEAVSRWRRERL
ncbi:low temperature requirement protein A [Micromonospora siamensis]|uniref:low temperature requirement protein A n=1 Tax=Micromonospora siamensis TaxID=299152 RepID=UPI0012FE05A7|nr:low temperature requirement protein A [Micromonospora siamensis]